MRGCSGGCAWLLPGEHAWLLRGHAWLLPRGVWLLQGGHVWLLWGGMHGCSGGHVWLLWGACMVAPGGGMHGCSRGHAWLLWGDVHGCSQGAAWLLPGGVCGCCRGACMVAPGRGLRGIQRDTEIRSMSGRYASYWNAFLFYLIGTEDEGKEVATYRYNTGSEEEFVSESRQVTLVFTSVEGASHPTYPRGFLASYKLGMFY